MENHKLQELLEKCLEQTVEIKELKNQLDIAHALIAKLDTRLNRIENLMLIKSE